MNIAPPLVDTTGRLEHSATRWGALLCLAWPVHRRRDTLKQLTQVRESAKQTDQNDKRGDADEDNGCTTRI